MLIKINSNIKTCRWILYNYYACLVASMWSFIEGDFHVLRGSSLSHFPELQEGRRGDLPALVESTLQTHPNLKVAFISRAF